MKMTEAKKEIEEKMFCGAPLSLDAMLCALAALNHYIEERGPNSFVMLDIKTEDDELNKHVSTMLSDMLQQAIATSEEKGKIDGYSSQIFIDGF